MPWKNVSPMDQKLRLVSLAGSGHFTMTELCRDFGVSRKTGHKWVARHAVGGMKGLEECSRAPKSVTCRTSDKVERLICTEKRLRSTWGPKKIRQVLMTKHGVESPPAVSTVGEVLKRHGIAVRPIDDTMLISYVLESGDVLFVPQNNISKIERFVPVKTTARNQRSAESIAALARGIAAG